MRARAIRDLMQLSDADFLAAVPEGLDLIVKNVGRLWDGAAALGEAGKSHAARVLAVIAEEETAKFLILLDAVRCPRQPDQRLSRQLARFNDHLAKGLYARAYGTRPTTLADLQSYVDSNRDAFYLDGPNGIDWIFRNDVAQGREGKFYVDYIDTDDGHRWSDPAEFEAIETWAPPEPCTIRTMRSLHAVGVTTPDALALIAALWRDAPPASETHFHDIERLNWRTLELMEHGGLLQEQPQDVYLTVHRDWQFPMYDLDLSLIEVDKEALRERQRNWTPDWD